MVDLAAPDLERFPRFAEAQQAAQSADLEPGDAIYIPFLWWHGVKSLDSFNALVNYWWNEARPVLGTPYECLFHSLMILRDLPDDQRRAWRSLFDHYVFEASGEATAHLPAAQRGLLGPTTPERLEKLRGAIVHSLTRKPR
jgi:hypothetical protein